MKRTDPEPRRRSGDSGEPGSRWAGGSWAGGGWAGVGWGALAAGCMGFLFAPHVQRGLHHFGVDSYGVKPAIVIVVAAAVIGAIAVTLWGPRR